jgi:hypothetical protein
MTDNIIKEVSFVPPVKEQIPIQNPLNVQQNASKQTNIKLDIKEPDELIGLKYKDEVEQELPRIQEVEDPEEAKKKQKNILQLLRYKTEYPDECKTLGIDNIDFTKLSADQVKSKLDLIDEFTDMSVGGLVNSGIILGTIGMAEAVITDEKSPLRDVIRIGGLSKMLASNDWFNKSLKKLSMKSSLADVNPMYVMAFCISSSAFQAHKLNTRYNTYDIVDAANVATNKAINDKKIEMLDKVKQTNSVNTVNPINKPVLNPPPMKIVSQQNAPLMPPIVDTNKLK